LEIASIIGEGLFEFMGQAQDVNVRVEDDPKTFGACQHRSKTTAFPPVLLLEVTAIGEDAVATLQ
jgi:hypothetical protein